VESEERTHLQQLAGIGMEDGAPLGLAAQSAPVRVVDAHAERPRSMRDRLTDPTHSIDAQRLAGELPPEQLGGSGIVPDSSPHHLLTFARPPRRPKQQKHSEIGGRVGEHVRRVRDDDAPSRRGPEIDVVEAHRERRYSAHRARQS